MISPNNNCCIEAFSFHNSMGSPDNEFMIFVNVEEPLYKKPIPTSFFPI